LGKWRALVRAALLTLREGRPLPVHVTADGATGMAETYLLFVGNNRYDLDLLRAGRRAALDAGELSVFALVETRRLRLVPHFLRALRERPARPRLFKGRVAREVIVTPDELRTVEVACDGEVLRLHTPLVYRTRPRALRVLVPRHGHSVRAA
jgi:diacylglycerol kinase family enzyme